MTDRWRGALARLPGDRGLGLAAWAAALFLVAPTITWYDDAEFVSAAFCLGVPHPTGFPVYDVLARLAQLVPIGSVPFRTHLLSLASAAGSVLLGVRLLRRAGVVVAPALALLVATLVVATRTLFLHAAAAEVYQPALLLVMAGLVLAQGAARDARRVVLLGLLVGLAGAHHAAAALILAALFVLAAVAARRRLGASGLILAVLAGVVGLSALGYLPLRAAAQPFRNWGDPRTWTAFVEHVSGARIARSFGEFGRLAPAVLAARAELLWRVVADDLGPLGLLAPVGALLLLLSRGRRLLGWLVVALVVDLAFTLVLNPMGIADRQTATVTLFVVLLLAVVPVAALAGSLRRLPLARGVLLLVAPALPLAVTPDALYEADLGRDEHALALGQVALEQARPGSIVITTSDHLSAGLLYLQGVEGFRLDTAHLVAAHVVESSHLRTLGRLHERALLPGSLLELADQLDRHPELRDAPRVQVAALRQVLDSATAARRTVLWEPGLSAYEHGLFQRPPAGFPLAVVDGADGNVAVQFRAFLKRADSHLSRESAGALSTWLSQAGTVAARRDDADGALSLLQQALFLDDRNPKALVNLGALLAHAGRLGEATTATERALALRPDFVLGLLNLARYRLAAGDREGALPLLSRAEALDDTPANRARVQAIRDGTDAKAQPGSGQPTPDGVH